MAAGAIPVIISGDIWTGAPYVPPFGEVCTDRHTDRPAHRPTGTDRDRRNVM